MMHKKFSFILTLFEVYFNFRIFDIIRSESKIMDGLSFFNIKDNHMKPFQHLDVKGKTDNNYLDIRDPAVIVS